MRSKKIKKLAVNITEEDFEKLMKKLEKQRQPLTEYLIIALSTYLNDENRKIERLSRVNGVHNRTKYISFKVSDWLYEKVEELAEQNDCPKSCILYSSIISSL